MTSEEKAALAFHRRQTWRYAGIAALILVADAALILACPGEPPWRLGAVSMLSGAVGAHLRFSFNDALTEEAKLHATRIMLRYWIFLLAGAILGFFSYMGLLEGRLLKLVYPRLADYPTPTLPSVALIAGLAGLLARSIVSIADRRLGSGTTTPSQSRPPEAS